MSEAWDKPVHDALDRMKRARDRGTGCHLTAEMIAALALSFLGEVWEQEAPLSTHQEQSHG
ncbi:hypothetical protein GCM10009075_38140 [Sphingomonas trueperi]